MYFAAILFCTLLSPGTSEIPQLKHVTYHFCDDQTVCLIHNGVVSSCTVLYCTVLQFLYFTPHNRHPICVLCSVLCFPTLACLVFNWTIQYLTLGMIQLMPTLLHTFLGLSILFLCLHLSCLQCGLAHLVKLLVIIIILLCKTGDSAINNLIITTHFDNNYHIRHIPKESHTGRHTHMLKKKWTHRCFLSWVLCFIFFPLLPCVCVSVSFPPFFPVLIWIQNNHHKGSYLWHLFLCLVSYWHLQFIFGMCLVTIYHLALNYSDLNNKQKSRKSKRSNDPY